MGSGIKELREGVSAGDDAQQEVPGSEDSRGEARAQGKASSENARTDAAERSL